MATLATTNIKHASSSSNNIVLASDGSTTISNLSGAGKLLQIATVSDTVRHTTGSVSFSQTYVTTPFAVTLTPASTSSKMMITAFFTGEPDTNEHEMQFAIRRAISGGSTTDILAPAAGNRAQTIAVPNQGYFADNNDSTPFNFSMSGLIDSPSTTSAVTYTLIVRAATGSRVLYYNRNANDGNYNLSTERTLSWLTIMEVAG